MRERRHYNRTILTMQEAIVFAVIANNVAGEDHMAVINGLTGAVLARLNEFRQHPEQFVAAGFDA
jgi:hypothetical protein